MGLTLRSHGLFLGQEHFAQLDQRLVLYLPHAFAGYIKLFADFLKCHFAFAVEVEAFGEKVDGHLKSMGVAWA